MAQLAPVDETLPVESATDWQAVVGVLSLIAAEAFVYGFSFPYFSLALRHVGLSAGTIGLNASLGGIGIVFVGPFIPRLLDRFGLRPLTIIQFTVSAVCFAVLILVRSTAVWFAVRFVTGAVLASVWTTTEVWLNAAAANHQRGRILGLSGTLYAVCQFVGPLVLSRVGVSGQAPVLAAAAPLAIGALIATGLQRAPKSNTGASGPPRRAPALAVRSARYLMLAALTAGVMEASMQSLLPLFGATRGLSYPSAARLVSAFSVGEALSAVILGLLADRFGARRVLILTLLLGTSSSLLLLVPSIHSLALPGLLIIAGGTIPSVYMFGIVLIGTHFRGPELIYVTTRFTITYSIGAAIGPASLGVMMGAFGSSALPVAIAGIAVATIFVIPGVGTKLAA
jgi:MFS family permease